MFKIINKLFRYLLITITFIIIIANNSSVFAFEINDFISILKSKKPVPKDFFCLDKTCNNSNIGYTGFTGPIGFTGVIGTTGASGFTGEIGFTGLSGIQGATGLKGENGQNGLSSLEIVSESNTIIEGERINSKTVFCPSGKKVISGGFSNNNENAYHHVLDNYPSSDSSWTVKIYMSSTSTSWTMKVYAICAVVN